MVRPRADKNASVARSCNHKCAKLRRTHNGAGCVAAVAAAAAGHFFSEIKQRAGGYTLTWQQINSPPSADRPQNGTFVGLNARIDLIFSFSPNCDAANTREIIWPC